jgi:hypothetical protein
LNRHLDEPEYVAKCLVCNIEFTVKKGHRILPLYNFE